MAPNDRLPSLTALRAFHAAGQSSSFQDAARAINVTPSAISHQIRSLEQFLETPLFERGTRRVTLTQDGKSFHQEIDRAFDRIAAATSRLRKREDRTHLKVSALPLFTNAWLIPRLSKFEARHPHIVLDIETSNRVTDVEGGEADIAIRNLITPPKGLAARKLLDVRGIPLCSAKLVSGRHPLKNPADLVHHTLIHVTARPKAWHGFLRSVGLRDLKPKRELSFDTIPAALEAAARGHGVTLGMDPIVWDSPIASSLVVPFEGSSATDASYYIVHRKSDRSRPAVRAFVDWLITEMALFRQANTQRRH